MLARVPCSTYAKGSPFSLAAGLSAAIGTLTVITKRGRMISQANHFLRLGSRLLAMYTDFQSSIGYWITLTSHFYQQRLREELIQCGITFRQFQVMAWLVHDGQLSQRALVDRLMIEPPTLVGILNRMQREGWIDRRQDAKDRRCKWVALRSEAEPVWNEISGCLARIRERATRDMSAREQGRLKELLMKVQGNLGVPADILSKPNSSIAE